MEDQPVQSCSRQYLWDKPAPKKLLRTFIELKDSSIPPTTLLNVYHNSHGHLSSCAGLPQQHKDPISKTSVQIFKAAVLNINKSASPTDTSKHLWSSPEKRRRVSCSTVFLPWPTVVIRFALAEDFESWVTSDIEPLCKLSFSCGIDFSQRDGRCSFAELLGSLLVFWSKPLAVSTPGEGEQRALFTCH